LDDLFFFIYFYRLYDDDTNVLVYAGERGRVINHKSEVKETLERCNPFKGPYVGGVTVLVVSVLILSNIFVP
jgi:hypothetical protein